MHERYEFNACSMHEKMQYSCMILAKIHCMIMHDRIPWVTVLYSHADVRRITSISARARTSHQFLQKTSRRCQRLFLSQPGQVIPRHLIPSAHLYCASSFECLRVGFETENMIEGKVMDG